jgi:formylglycine-generating enzyme required for sulfatase activity
MSRSPRWLAAPLCLATTACASEFSGKPLPGFGGTDGFERAPHGGELVRFLPGGSKLGCTEGQLASACEDDEKPVFHATFTEGFALGATEITQAQYAAVMNDNRPSGFEDCGDDCPVENLKWHQAAAFANALSELQGLESCYLCIGSGAGVSCDFEGSPYQCQGYRLPTEAEWEYAARCGEDQLFSGSDNLAAVGWTASSTDQTHPVAQLAPTACGTYDMTGNVYEWVHDRYGGDYPQRSANNPVYEGTCSDCSGLLDDTELFHGFRGGSWKSQDRLNRVSFRNYDEPEARLKKVGFRIARTL